MAGKGHENYQEYKKKKFFSDKLEILKSVAKKNKNLSKSIKTNILKETLKSNVINIKKIINSASINSNKIKNNSIFVGIKGKKYDGNKFGNSALKNGALLSIINKKKHCPKTIFRKDPLKFFHKISLIFRKSLNTNIISITGSSGKTSVKELTSFCLNKFGKTYFSKKSFNNKYGVPLSIFNTPEQSKFAVLEVGMNKKGEINSLTKLIRPDIGLITNISYAHIQNFKNLNQIAEAKGEIINNITPNGTMIINMDDKYYKYFLKKTIQNGLKSITFSTKKTKADVSFLSQKKYKNNYLLKTRIKGITKTFKVSKELSNYKENILASLSIICSYFDVKELKKNLFQGFCIPKSRGSLIKYKKGLKKLTILDESYNSNPLSLKFALERFNLINIETSKKYLLIGDMLELGAYSKKLHIEIAKYINNSKVNKTYVYGRHTKHTFNKLKPQIRGRILTNTMDIYNLINKVLPNNSLLMVKGSNSTGLNRIIQKL